MAPNLDEWVIRVQPEELFVTAKDVGLTLATDFARCQAAMFLAFAETIEQHWAHPNPLSWPEVCTEIASELTAEQAKQISEVLQALVAALAWRTNESTQAAETEEVKQ